MQAKNETIIQTKHQKFFFIIILLLLLLFKKNIVLGPSHYREGVRFPPQILPPVCAYRDLIGHLERSKTKILELQVFSFGLIFSIPLQD